MVTARSAVEVRRLREFRSLPWPGPLWRKAARGALALQPKRPMLVYPLIAA